MGPKHKWTTKQQIGQLTGLVKTCHGGSRTISMTEPANTVSPSRMCGFETFRQKASANSRLHSMLYVSPANCVLSRVGLPGLEPGTSSLSEKRGTFPKISRVCNIPANKDILYAKLFPSFQVIRLGCCTQGCWAELEYAVFSDSYSSRKIGDVRV